MLNRRYWHTLVHLSNTSVPHMYLYSRLDPLVSYKDVECVAAQAEAVGHKVTLVTFAESSHVDHLVKHGEIYRHKVLDFVVRSVAHHTADGVPRRKRLLSMTAFPQYVEAEVASPDRRGRVSSE